MTSVLGTVLRQGFNALFHPARRTVRGPGALRQFVALPRVFDVVSVLLQLRHLGAVQRLQTRDASGDAHIGAVHEYNASKTVAKLVTSTRRAEPVYRIASQPSRDVSGEPLLIVGPRNVQEFLVAWIHGFRWRNITAIDLYSAHPKIVVMDMHRITYPDESFGVVTMVNTLGYASDIGKVVAGIYRILRPGGRFCFSHAHVPESAAFPGDLVSGDTVLSACRDAGFEVYFHQSVPKMTSENKRQTSHFIGVEKPARTGGAS